MTTPHTISEPRTHNDYNIGWVCALPKELIAAAAMLDETHPDLPRQPNDYNAYTLGRVGGHNIVVACLPKGEIGNSNSATVAARMTSTFPSIRFGLMVGIGGGVPKSVRLGDIVVSTPTEGFGGVVQWDFGKTEQGGVFKRTGALNRPPNELLAGLTKLEKDHSMKGSKIPQYLEELKKNWPKLAPKYSKSESLKDVLFRADCKHVEKPVVCNISNSDDSFVNIGEEYNDQTEDEEQGDACLNCDHSKVVHRKPRDMCVHYGLIASGNQVVKDAAFRDKINKRLGGKVLCFEMEAAGLMNDFPCIVIRGICDYADSHKNKDWQEYAAAVAAAYAKELLSVIPAQEVQQMLTIKSVLGEISTDIKKILSRQLDQDQQAVLEWLTPINYASQYSDYLGRRQPGTGQWLLDSEVYQAWLKTSKQTLFCPGIPGAGKTILTSIVIDSLRKQFQNDESIGLAYLYCNFRRQDEQRAEDLIASVLKQLSQEQSCLPNSLKELYEHHKDKQTRPLFEEILRASQSVAAVYSKVFIIVDALDECQVSNGCQARFLSGILNLQAQCKANLFVTSRFIPEITEKFHGNLSLEIYARDNDVQKYLDAHMSRLPSFVLNSLELQHEIKNKISKAVHGMFLLAHLHVDSLTHQPTIGHIKQALQNLPKGLDETYEQAMKRIESQGEGSRELARKVLYWIIYAKRTLSTAELQHALAVQPGKLAMDKDFIPSIGTVGSICAGLVSVDIQSDVVRLVHHTTQEYFRRTSWFPNTEASIAEACVTYISFDAFSTGFCSTLEEFRGRLRANPLYDYAAKNWGYHAYSASTKLNKELRNLILDLLQNEAKVSGCSQAMRYFPYYIGIRPTRMTGVHLAAYFGLVEAAMDLLNNGNDPDTEDYNSSTPLLYAAMNGHDTVVELLIERGVKLETNDMYAQAPLSFAARYGHKAVVKLLLAKGAELEAKNFDGQTSLSVAVSNKHEEVVELLLEKGAELETKDENRRTPLLLAVIDGCETVVNLLLEKGAERENKDKNGQTPLSWAARKGHEMVVKLLLQKGAELENKDDSGRTPLAWAVINGDKAIVKLLLENGAELETEDKYNQTLLFLAVMKGYEVIVKLLLEKGARLKGKDKDGQTLLSWIAIGGREVVVKLLLEKGAELETKDKYGQTPLSWAAEKGHEVFIKLLIDKGAELETNDENGQTPLSWAAKEGHEVVAKLLIEEGTELETKDKNNQKPLSWAAREGHEMVVKLLIEKGAELETKDKDGQTPLSWAAREGHEVVAKLLTEKGAELETKDKNNQKPLSWAAKKGREVVVKLLIEKGAELETKDKDGQTPLSWAAREGHEVVVKLLIEKGAELETKDKDGQTPLSWVAKKGHEVVVKLLIEKGAELETKDKDGQTPLSWAAKKGHEVVVKLLIEKGAELETKDKNGQTPLSWAAREGHEVVAKLLIEKGAELETKNKYGRTPLYWAVHNGDKVVVELLLEKGAEQENTDFNNQTPLALAVFKGHKAIIEILLEEGTGIETKDDTGRTSLSLAAENELGVGVVELLLEKGAEPDTKDDSGRTPLSWAAEKWFGVEIVELLLEKGAELETKDDSGRTPLSWAVEKGYGKVVARLLEKGAELETKDKIGRTPLSWAVENSYGVVIVRLLLNKGAELETKNDSGRTPLSWAVENAYGVGIVELLLKKGAELETKDKIGRTPLSWAVENRYGVVIARLLLNKGAELKTKDDSGRTPLSWAAGKGCAIEIVEFLLEKGAELETKDDSGRTPLTWATEEGHWALVELLLDRGAQKPQ